MRIITAVPAQAVFAVIMGFFLGEAKLFRSRRLLYSVLALVLAALAHGYYDYVLYLSNIRGLWLQAIVSLVLVVVLTNYALKVGSTV
jgi:RsiW-degrading membrane proteinase PrsW (M82 family)